MQKKKLIKACEFGYDSTWSEVEQILDKGVNLPLDRVPDKSKVESFKSVRKRFGLVAVVIIHNMMQDEDLSEKFISDGLEIQSTLHPTLMDEEKASYLF